MSRISFTSFNLLNLNEPGRPMYRDAAGWTETEVEDKVAWISGMLHRASADVIGFQELWHAGPLQRAIDRSDLAETHVVLAPEGLDGEGIVCAAAVRRDLLEGEPEWIARFPDAFRLQSEGEDRQTARISVSIDTFSRPVLHFQVKAHPAQAAVHVFVCHFKSKGPTQMTENGWFNADPDLYKPHGIALGSAISTIRRTAEATALRVILTSLMKNTATPVVVLGDLNDGQDSNTLDILTEQPKFLQPLSTGGRDTALYSGQALQQLRSLRDVYFTYIHQGVHGSLDHILVSEQFYDNSRKRIWKFDELDIFNDHLNAAGLEKASGSGDHGVVRARFSYRP